MDLLNTIKIFIYENKKKLILASCLLIITVAMTIFFLNENSYKTESIVYENLNSESLDEKRESEPIEEGEYYYVDVKGAVKIPGVYSLAKGKRVVDAINEAGGLQENGDTSLLNLSMELTDGMVIVVYSKDEVKKYDTIEEEQNNKICTQNIMNDACISNNKENTDKATAQSNNDTSEASQKNAKININTASVQELINLPKIGEAKAKAIVDYRIKNGNFKTIEDLKNVSGIGDATFETLKDNITV